MTMLASPLTRGSGSLVRIPRHALHHIPMVMRILIAVGGTAPHERRSFHRITAQQRLSQRAEKQHVPIDHARNARRLELEIDQQRQYVLNWIKLSPKYSSASHRIIVYCIPLYTETDYITIYYHHRHIFI